MKGSDGFVAVLILIGVLALAAVGGRSVGGGSSGSSSSKPSPTAARTTAATTSDPGSTNIPKGALPSCPGWVIGQRTSGRGADALTLTVYYSPSAGGRNCALAQKKGTVGSSSHVSVALRFSSYTGSAWPRYAFDAAPLRSGMAGGVYLDNADGRCVDATAEYRSGQAKPRRVNLETIGCR